MEYSVMLDVIDEPGFEGCYYAHIPVLELTTHGKGIDGELAAAKELAEVWIAEERARGESVPRESGAVIARIEVSDAILGS